MKSFIYSTNNELISANCVLGDVLGDGNSEINKKYILPIMEFIVLVMVLIPVCHLAQH